jgi:hypothetical protein
MKVRNVLKRAWTAPRGLGKRLAALICRRVNAAARAFSALPRSRRRAALKARCWLLTLGFSAAVLAPSYAEDDLGRLFWTATERARLDQARRGGAAESERGTADAAAQTQTTVNVKGIVVRHDGRHTVWVDDTSTLRDSAVGGTLLIKPEAVNPRDITVGVGRGGAQLKPGQMLNVQTGEVREGYAAKPSESAAKRTQAPVTGSADP